jgi:hypothetical protein
MPLGNSCCTSMVERCPSASPCCAIQASAVCRPKLNRYCRSGGYFVNLLDNLNKASGPNFKGCDWQTTDRVEIDRFLRDPLNGKPFCNRMMYGVLQGILQVWTPENEQRIPKDLPILITCGTRDPVGGMTASVRALIERYRRYGVKELSHISTRALVTSR